MFRLQRCLCLLPALILSTTPNLLYGDDGSVRYESPSNAFSILFPNSWVQDTHHASGVEIFAYDPSSMEGRRITTAMTVMGEANQPPVSLQRFTQDWRLRIRKITSPYGKFQSYGSGVLTIDGVNAIWDTHSVQPVGGREVKSKVYIVMKSDRRYIISCMSPVESFDQFQTRCDDVVRTFRFTRP